MDRRWGKLALGALLLGLWALWRGLGVGALQRGTVLVSVEGTLTVLGERVHWEGDGQLPADWVQGTRQWWGDAVQVTDWAALGCGESWCAVQTAQGRALRRVDGGQTCVWQLHKPKEEWPRQRLQAEWWVVPSGVGQPVGAPPPTRGVVWQGRRAPTQSWQAWASRENRPLVWAKEVGTVMVECGSGVGRFSVQNPR